MALEIKEKWKQEQSTVRLLLFTFSGAIIEFLIFMPHIMQLFLHPETILQHQQQPNSISLPPLLDSPLFVGAYFAIPVIYCITTSLSFSQKRIVSPLNIQIFTFGIIAVFILLLVYSQNPFEVVHPKELFSVMSYIFAVILGFGFAQTYIVKLVVGLNGTKDEINQKTYRLDMSFDQVSKIILDKEFKDTWYFRTRKNTDKIIMKSKFLTTENLLLGLQKDPESKDHCILSMASYEVKFYKVQGTKRVWSKQESIFKNLKEKIGESRINSPPENDYEISEIIEELALGQTHNQLLFFTRLEGTHKKVLIGLGIVLALMTYLHFAGPLTTDSYLTSIILIGIAIVTDLIPVFTKTSKSNDF